jgi:hypothetical protein
VRKREKKKKKKKKKKNNKEVETHPANRTKSPQSHALQPLLGDTCLFLGESYPMFSQCTQSLRHSFFEGFASVKIEGKKKKKKEKMKEYPSLNCSSRRANKDFTSSNCSPSVCEDLISRSPTKLPRVYKQRKKKSEQRVSVRINEDEFYLIFRQHF